MPSPSTRPPPRRMAWGLQVFAAMVLLWLALNGSTAPLLGLVVAAIAALAGSLLVPGEARPLRLRRVPVFLAYFLWQSLLGGWDVARRALSPRLDLQPGFVDLPLTLPAGQPRTLLVAVLSLLPGSVAAQVVVAAEPGGDLVRVHLLSLDKREGLAALQRQVAALFGIEHEGPA